MFASLPICKMSVSLCYKLYIVFYASVAFWSANRGFAIILSATNGTQLSQWWWQQQQLPQNGKYSLQLSCRLAVCFDEIRDIIYMSSDSFSNFSQSS